MPDRYDNLATRLSKVYSDIPKTGAELRKRLSSDKELAGKLYDVVSQKKELFPGLGSRDAFIKTYSGGYSVTPQRKQQASSMIGGKGYGDGSMVKRQPTNAVEMLEQNKTPQFEASYDVKDSTGKVVGKRKVNDDIKMIANRTLEPMKQQFVDKNGNVVKEQEVYPLENPELSYERALKESVEANDLERQSRERLAEIEREENALKKKRTFGDSFFMQALANMSTNPSASTATPGATQSRYDAYKTYKENRNPELDVLEARKKLAEDRIKLIEDAKKDMGIFTEGNTLAEKAYNVGRGLLRAREKTQDVLFNKSTWDFGASDANTQMAILDAATKFGNGEKLSEGEKKLLDDWALSTAVNSHYGSQLSGWTKAAMVTGESAPFMIEMAINPASGLGQAAQKGMIKMGMKKFGKELIEKQAKSILSKRLMTKAMGLTGRLGGDFLGANIMAATTGAARVASDTARRMTGEAKIGEGYKFEGTENGETLGDALSKAFKAQAIEYGSEMAGEYFGFVNNAIGKIIGKSAIGKEGRKMLAATGSIDGVPLGKAQKFIYDLAANKGVGAFSKGLDQFLKKTKWNGVIGEYAEEVLGNIANAATVGDKDFSTKENGVFNLEENIDTFCGVALMGGFMSALNTAGFVGHKINYNPERISNNLSESIDNWGYVKTSIDNAAGDPREINDLLTDMMSSNDYTKEQKKGIMKYTASVLEQRGQEMAAFQPRVEDIKTDKNGSAYTVSTFDKNGKVIEENTFNSQEDADAYKAQVKMQQQKRDLEDYLDMSGRLTYGETTSLIDEFLNERGYNEADESTQADMLQAINDTKTDLGREFRDFKNLKSMEKAQAARDAIRQFEEENGWEEGSVMYLSEQDPMTMNGDLLGMADQAREFLKGLAYPNTEVHTEISEREGSETAEEVLDGVMSSTEPIDPMNNPGKEVVDSWDAARKERNELFEKDENLKEEVESMEAEGFSPQEIISSLDTFTDSQKQVLINYYNAKAKYDSYMLTAENKINEAAAQGRKSRTFTGTIDGQEDKENLLQVTDGTNTYTMIGGDVTTKDGVITGSDSGIVLALDENGDIVTLPDKNLTVSTGMTLDEWEAQEVERLELQMTTVSDSEGKLMEEQGGNNADVEAGGENTGADEASATAPSESALERIPKDEQGNPIYEQGTPEDTYDALTEQVGESAQILIKNQLDAAKKRHEKLVKDKETGKLKGKTLQDQIAEIKELQDKIDAEDALVKFWTKVMTVPNNRRADEEVKAPVEETPQTGETVNETNEESAPDWSVDKASEARARGYRMENGYRVDRQQPITEKVEGNDTEVKFDKAEEPVKGKITVVESGSLIPSHVNGQRNVMFFIDEAQPKERTDVDSEASSNRIAEKVNPEEITGGVTAYTGSPVVNSRGEVIQGNNRTIGMQKMWNNAAYEESQKKYKQYLIDHAAEFGLDPKQIEKMNAPVMVRMVDVSDDEAIRLGQKTAANTESGGKERIDPQRVIQQMGDNFRVFTNQLFSGEIEDQTLLSIIAENGVKVLKWLNDGTNHPKYITDTQFQSCFDNKGNLTEEAKTDLRRIVENMLFVDAPERLADMFYKMPAKAQNAILSTIWRDSQSEKNDRIIKDIQSSIEAFTVINGASEEFRGAKDVNTARAAVKDLQKQTQMFGDTETVLEKFSNFALELAIRYKGDKQNSIRSYFNNYYDAVQGKGGSLFESAAKKAKEQAIKDIFDIDINENENGTEGSNTVESDTGNGTEREPVGEGEPAVGEPVEEGEQPTVSGGGTETNEEVTQSREDYLASHPLTEEQIMADTEATEDEKLNAIDFLKGEDDSAISRFYYDSIYNRAQKTPSSEKRQKKEENNTPREKKEEETPKQPQDKWSYNFHYDKETGRAWITRDDWTAGIPIEDGRFRIEGRSLAELRGILENPRNNMGDVLQAVEASLHNAEALEELRKQNDPLQAMERAANAFREEQKAKDQQDIDNALDEFNKFLDDAKGSNVLDKFMRKGIEGNDKAQASLLDAFTLTNDAQRMFLKDLLRLASKVGYAYIKSGVHDVQAWSKKMSDSIGRKLKEVLGWDDAIVGEFVDEVWNQKYTVDGQRMRLSEHAERLKNHNGADTTVNDNKQENNEAEKVVSSQQKAAKPQLEGDSAEFAERQEKVAKLREDIGRKLRQAVLTDDNQIKTMQSVKALATQYGLDDISMTDLQELVEAEIVDLARTVAQSEEWSEQQKFDYIVKLYNSQPSLNARDNDRINKQQYSTPAPMAYLMGLFTSKGKKVESGLEPSAGNGMLTIGLPKEKMHVNDIDEMRLSNLQKQGFGEVTSQDGLLSFGEKQYDVIVTNPPFGNVTPKTYDGLYEISGLEHQMAINALESMKDDGRAAIIIGGNTEYNQNGSIKGKDRVFLNYLYAHYNVVDVINMDGKTLYSRQGTGFPVRMILINGRKEFNAKDFAPVQSKARAERVNSYDELLKRVNDDILSNENKPAGVHDTESGESGRVDDISNAGTSTQTGVRDVRTEGGEGQPSVRPSVGRSVQRSGSTTNGTDTGVQSAVDSRPSGVESRPSAAQSSGSTVTQTEAQRDLFDGRDNTERPVAEPVESSGGRRSSRVEDTHRVLGEEKVPYIPQSKNPYSLQSQMPAEQADVVKKALEKLGDVDTFLVNELGYSSVEDMWHGSQSPENHGGLAADQVDSVAMAIHQMNQGNAFIIGDQTGIGKGRQAAALIRYGVKKGGCPVFITVKKALFSDMYRDLCDIGSPDLKPFIWSADDTQHSGAVTDKDGNVIYEMPSKKEQERVVEYINKNGKLPPEYDYVLTTYDSFKSGTMVYENGTKAPRQFPKGKKPSAIHYNGQAKRDALETLASSSYVIMDESHNAGGEGSNVSGYLQYITSRAKGITFLSATFAKRPGNMPIYSLKTAISKAGVDIDELIDAVKRGGATFQEIMSKALTEAGQMIRRERDMTGVTIDWKGIDDEAVVQKQREQYDQVIGLFNDIINFQRTYVDPMIDRMNDAAADIQGEVNHTPGTRDMGINNTPFASRTYNIVQQVLLSLKAEEAAKRAIEHLKAEHKPVITVANTNEGAADEVAAAGSEAIEMPDLSVNLKKGLRGTLRFTEKDSFGNTVNREIPFDSLSPEGQARYREIMDAIDKASTGLSLSPIDVIKNELKKAGYKVGELTGRQSEFVYNEDGTVNRVKRTGTDKKKTASDFNNGRLDALILNKSAGTGISLHASTKFDDQHQRVMIVAQAQGDVNDEVQIRGRIDRTGQVLRGMYEYIVSQIPSEQRLLMMLKAKLRSLDANTTSSQKSKFNEMDVQDIINKYGDDIVIQYLAEHTDLADKMCNPLKWKGDWQVMSSEQLVADAEKSGESGQTASKVLGRMALLTVREQEKMLNEIGELYQAEIDRLNEMGENDLEITEMPLKAKTIEKEVWEQGIEPGGNNPFADNSYVEKVQMDVLKKPMKAEEVKRSQARLLGGKTWEEYKKDILEKVDEWAENKKKETTETITARAEKKAKAEQERYVKGAKKSQEKNGMTDEEIEKNGQFQYNTIYQQEIDKLNDALAGIEKQKQVFVDALDLFNTDNVYAIPSNIYDLGGMTFEPGMGKLIDIKISDNYSTTASTLSFATLDGRRKITVPVSGMVKQQNDEKRSVFPAIMSLTAQAKNGMFGSNVSNTMKVLAQDIDNWDRLTSSAARKEGYIITGNLLKALVSTREQKVGGKLISYTTDTGEVRQGILMPDNFNPSGLTSKTPISSMKDELRYSRDSVVSADGDVTVRVGSWDWATRGFNTLELIVPKSKKKGEKYFNDKALLKLMNGQFEGSSKMKAEFKRENLDAVMSRLDELGVTVQSNKEDSQDNATRRFDEDIDEDMPHNVPGSNYKVGTYREWEDGIDEDEQLANVFKDGEFVGKIYYSPGFGYIAYPTDESLVMEDYYPTEAEAIQALERLYNSGDEHYGVEKPKEGYYTSEEGQAKMDEIAARYPSIVRVGVTHKHFTDNELIDALFGKGTAEMLIKSGLGDKMSKITDFFRELIQKAGEMVGGFIHKFNKILIFADETRAIDYEEVYFHENIHAFLNKKYGDIDDNGKVPIRDIAEHFWNNAGNTVGDTTKEFVKENYKNNPEAWAEEFFAYCVSRSMSNGNLDITDKFIKDDSDKLEFEELLNLLGYDRAKETKERRRGERRFSETNRKDDGRVPPSRRARRKPDHNRHLSANKQRIAKHIDALAEKLGTRARTTVYHSLSEVPEGLRQYIEEAHKRGRKVRGWYENGQIYLFLPDINSTYEAEKTIWHETVAHHGLRQLVGDENLDSLLRQLWLTHKDGAMGKWVTERMTRNGWALNEAIEEYLAREAEKHPFEQPSLWQRLRWMLADALHKIGFATDPTISDIQYLFWVSQNRLREGDALSVAKQQAFLHRLERAASTTPHRGQEDDGRRNDESAPIFVSNALDAVAGIKQEKATPEQWLKMIEKNGGLKAGEDKWMGLSEWLKGQDKKSLTKQEVLDFIRENQIQIEEVNYADQTLGRYDEHWDYLRTWLKENTDNPDAWYNTITENYGYRDGEGFSLNQGTRMPKQVTDMVDRINKSIDKSNPINSTRLSYTTKGLENKKEIALTVPTVESWNEGDEIHFGDAGNGRAVAWVRFGETTDADGKKVLVIDEIQSKRHQEGREKGYKGNLSDEEWEIASKWVASNDVINRENDRIHRLSGKMLEEAKDRIAEAEGIKQELIDTYGKEYVEKLADKMPKTPNSVPDAPFDKNWHELAMKRMLRYAAENGYDKVAWTKGAQQAERYGIGNKIEEIVVAPYEAQSPSEVNGKDVTVFYNGTSADLFVAEDGTINSGNPLFRDKNVKEVFGKELADKILSADKFTKINGENLRIGGEGMKGFYDQMLPRFMDKYGKRWGAKTGEIVLSRLGDNGITMWSVDVTPSMKRSVMEGQRMFDEDIEEPINKSVKRVYEETLNTKAYVFTEAFQDAMLALKVFMNSAIKKGEKILDSQNAYMAENLMHGKSKNEMDLFNEVHRKGLEKIALKIIKSMGWTMRDFNIYLMTKSGLERNREFYVRDWLEKNKDKDGVNDIRDKWLALKEKADNIDENYTFADYLDELTDFIKKNINSKYDPSKHDYSGLTEMYGDVNGKYDDGKVIEEVMNNESAMNDIDGGTVNELWSRINAANMYSLERYREAGMKTDEQIDNIEKMFHWYVPMRGFDMNTGEDVYQYFTSKAKSNSYVGGLIKHAKGRRSMANSPMATMFAMAYKAISDCNENRMKQYFYRFCLAHPNDLVVINSSWARLDEASGEWKEVWPNIPEDATDVQVRDAIKKFEEENAKLASEGKAKKITGKAKLDYKPIDKKHRSEHTVDVMVNGQKKLMTIVGNPRVAQALNGHTRWGNGNNILSKANASIKNMMSSAFTSYSPTFAMRNMLRDWTHFAMMLNTREGAGYAKAALNYYRETLPRPYHGKKRNGADQGTRKIGMMELFKKYRAGTLDMNKEVERDFKDFMDNGGVTGYVQMNKVGRMERELKKMVGDRTGAEKAKDKVEYWLVDNLHLQGTIDFTNKTWDAVLGLVEAYNEAVENNARFATYRASRHYANRTKARSAYDAKEITVNFNRKGSGHKIAGFKTDKEDVKLAAQTLGVTSQVVGEGRIFFNATIQAIANTFKNFQNPDGTWNKKYISKWAAKYAIPPFGFGLLLPFLNDMLAALLGGDDDDPYANLPDWVRRKNLCIYVGDNNFITIPVGQELSAFLALGDIAAANLYKPELKPVDKEWDDEVRGILTTFSPIDIEQKVTKGGLKEDPISETVGRISSVLAPLVAVEQNLSWTGREIYREDKYKDDKYRPEYKMIYSGTNPVLVGILKFLHELSGGDDAKRGKLEVNPAIVQYLWEQYTGGPGKVFSNTISIGKDVKDLAGEVVSGKPIDTDFNIRKVEGLKAFVQQGDDRTEYYRTNAKYRKYREDADELYNRIKEYKRLASEDPSAKMKLDRLMKGEEYTRMKIVRAAEKILSKERKSTYDVGGAEKRKRTSEYNKHVKEVVDRLDDIQ